MIGIYAGTFVAVTQYSKLKAKPPVTYESKEQESFVKRYIEHAERESHKPLLLRTRFAQ